MNENNDASLASVVEAARRGELIVFAGAGISMAAPSCLPDWKGFNLALLEEIKASALALPGLPESAAAAIRRLDIEELGVEALSDAVVQSFAGESYFPLLEVLDSDQPNTNHEAIAQLARRGHCRGVVTTNFDTLLESAFRKAGLACDVLETPEDFRESPRSDCPIYKIHGSVTATRGLVDTVSQKLRGLSFPVRARLIDIYHRYHVLVVGFSGEDLKFGADYLALSALKDSERGITWVTRPRRELNAQAEAFVRAANGSSVHADLTEVFERLGVSEPRAVPPGAHVADTDRAEADKRAAARIRAWLEQLGGGPLSSAYFCVALADNLGWRTEADAMRAALAADLERRGQILPLNAIAVFNGLATGADWAGDYAASERWARRALGGWAEFERRRQVSTEPVSPAGLRDMTKQFISSWTQIGRARAGVGDLSAARDAYARARQAAEEIQDMVALALLAGNEVQLLRRADSSVEKQIEHARRAWRLAALSGSAQVMTESALLEALALTTIGEYDAALAALERAERTVRWSGSLLSRLAPELSRADLASRRGHPEEAAQGFERAIALASEDPVLAERIRLVAVSTLVNHPSTRARALAAVDQVLSEMADGRIPKDGSNALLASEDEARALREEVLRIAAAAETFVPSLPNGVPDTERELRAYLLKAECANDQSAVAGVLRNLARARYDAARPRRMLDLAEGAAHAAKRSNSREDHHRALHLLGIARDLCGDFHGAIAACRELLDASPPADEVLRIAASQSLAHVLAKIGRVSEANALMRGVMAYREKQGNIAEHTRSIISLADTLARGGDATGARIVLEDGAGVIERSGDRLAVAKRDEMLASLREQERGPRMPAPLLFADSDVRVTIEQLAELRRKSETPQEECDIAVLALASGHFGAAVDIVLQAQASFHQKDDPQGLARCFHLLADAAQADGRWDSALDFTRHALAVEQDLEDVPGRIASYAAMSLQSIVVARFDQAVWAGTECLKHSRAGEHIRSRTIAICSLAEARWRMRASPDARRDVERAREELRVARDLPHLLRAWLEQRLAALSSRSALRISVENCMARLFPRARM
jgi:tetratricopeptide (TPR) repeat protein